MKVVVVGNGMAGSRLVQDLCARDPHRRPEITVLGAEPGGCYNRVLLSQVLAGRARVEDIALTTPSWYAERGVELRSGVAGVVLDRARREIRTDAGERIGYDAVVLATGSRAVIPPITGLRSAGGELRPGAQVFRTLADCTAIVAQAQTAQRVIVVGGGLLGLEAARGLAARGLPVTVLHAADVVMERQLDAAAGRVLGRTLGRIGVRVLTGARSTAVLGTDRITGMRLDDGRHVEGDLLVLACGTQPETSLAAAAGLRVDSGIVVDDQLRSVTDPRIHALGDCVQHDGQVYGLVAPAWEQAALLADVLTGGTPRYTGTRTVTRLKAAGVELATMGEAHLDDGDLDDGDLGEGDLGAAELVRVEHAARGTYQKLLLRNGRIIGAILLGDTRAAGTITQLFDRGSLTPADPRSLLFGAACAPAADDPELLDEEATVCRCNGVTKGELRSCWRDGGRTVADLSAATRATTGCGTCRGAVTALVEWLARSEPSADPVPA